MIILLESIKWSYLKQLNPSTRIGEVSESKSNLFILSSQKEFTLWVIFMKKQKIFIITCLFISLQILSSSLSLGSCQTSIDPTEISFTLDNPMYIYEDEIYVPDGGGVTFYQEKYTFQISLDAGQYYLLHIGNTLENVEIELKYGEESLFSFDGGMGNSNLRNELIFKTTHMGTHIFTIGASYGDGFWYSFSSFAFLTLSYLEPGVIFDPSWNFPGNSMVAGLLEIETENLEDTITLSKACCVNTYIAEIETETYVKVLSVDIDEYFVEEIELTSQGTYILYNLISTEIQEITINIEEPPNKIPGYSRVIIFSLLSIIWIVKKKIEVM